MNHPNDVVTDLEEHAAEMNPNLDVIAGLRDVADWLSDHPELPAVWYGSVNFDAGYDEPRKLMRQIADTLAERAVEEQHGGDVTIKGTFLGGIAVQVRASVSKLSDAPPVPEYEPIIQPREPVSLPVEDFDV